MKKLIKLLGIIAIVAIIGFSFAACDEQTDGNGTTVDIASFAGTWNASGNRSIVFSGNTFNYKVNNVTQYSGTFSASGTTITFNESSLGQASGNFALTATTLTLSNHTWDSSVNGTYTKEGGSSTTWDWDSNVDIYTAGIVIESSGELQKAAIWKNGVAQILSSLNSQALSVYVSGTDVYVAGYTGQYTDSRATLWKNGVAQQLSSSNSRANSVYVSGSDVYVAGIVGTFGGSDRRATIWKNGVAQTLSVTSATGATDAESIFVSGSDVYVTGWAYPVGATLWKNGVSQNLSNKANAEGGRSVFVSGTDVYVAASPTSGTDRRAVLYKNGVEDSLSTQPSSACSVFVSGSDVYVLGEENWNPTLWKNGGAQTLGENHNVASVFVSGSDVYISGQIYNGGAALWKNGVAKELGGSYYNSSAKSVFVVNKNNVSHICTFSTTTWEKNNTHHWRPCTVSGCNLKGSEAVHSSNPCVCGYTSGGNTGNLSAGWFEAIGSPATAYRVRNDVFGETLTPPNEVIIPATFNGLPVTEIQYNTFMSRTNITSVTISSSVTSIGNSAFDGCTNLVSITVPDSVTLMGYDVFHNTKWLANQPDGLVYAGKILYSYKGTMPSLTTINNIKTDTVGIAGGAFAAKGLASITIPNGVKSIGPDAFYSCTNITNLTIPSSVTTVGFAEYGQGAFINWTASQTINVPFANQEAADTAWGSHWQNSCSATINYVGGNTPTTWTVVANSTFDTTMIRDIAYGNNKFVAVGGSVSSGRAAYSSDGITWTPVADTKFGTNTINGIAWGNNKFVAVGSDYKVSYSSDGITWTEGNTNSAVLFSISCIAWGNDKFVIGSANSGSMAYSSDGITWQTITNPFSSDPSSGVRSIAYGNNKFVAVASNGTIAHSSNGITWEAVANSTFGSDYINGVTYGNNKFVAVGDSRKTASSSDGITWTQSTVSFSFNFKDVVYADNKFVGVGAYGYVGKAAYSSDGTTWTQLPDIEIINGSYAEIGGIAYGNNKFVVVGRNDAGGQIAYWDGN